MPCTLASQGWPSLSNSCTRPANTMWRKPLHSGLKTCFDPNPRCWDPISKHISNPEFASYVLASRLHRILKKRGAMCRVGDWRAILSFEFAGRELLHRGSPYPDRAHCVMSSTPALMPFSRPERNACVVPNDNVVRPKVLPKRVHKTEPVSAVAGRVDSPF